MKKKLLSKPLDDRPQMQNSKIFIFGSSPIAIIFLHYVHKLLSLGNLDSTWLYERKPGSSRAKFDLNNMLRQQKG